MNIQFHKFSEFPRGTIYKLLEDAYSCDDRWKQVFEENWLESDKFFYDNLDIADKYGFVTTLDGEPIGHISWDPRHQPEYVEIGHNCIATRYKGKGYGKMQLQEAIRRIKTYEGLQKIIVTTNEKLTPAHFNYASVGMKLVQKRENHTEHAFSGDYMYYEILL
ncbi:MAG: GNAT family N-acetyltransferase [Clostridium sp.]|nr:GNAT family N-acetyltransferase [Clostridium sp.]